MVHLKKLNFNNIHLCLKPIADEFIIILEFVLFKGNYIFALVNNEKALNLWIYIATNVQFPYFKKKKKMLPYEWYKMPINWEFLLHI